MPPRRPPAPATVADAPAQTPAPIPKRTQRARRAPVAPDKTPPPPPPPAQTKTRRQRCQPAPPAEPVPAPPVEPASIPVGSERPPVEPDRVGDGDGHAAARPRDIFDDDDPEGAAAGAAPRPYVHFAGRDSDDGEYFPDPPASPSQSPSPTRQSSSQRRQHRRSPRAGPHASPLPPPRHKGTDRSGSAKDVWTFFEPKDPQGTQKRECLFCKQCHAANPHIGTYKFSTNTSTGILRRHLYEHHVDAWVEGCDRLKIQIKAKEAARYVDEYRVRKHQTTSGTSTSEPGKKREQFSQEAFVDAIVEWIVGDDQSINVVENEQLRNIFLMLRSELKDSDIPHRTKIRKRIIEVWDEHLAHLESEMATVIGKISTTMDLWTDRQKIPFMAVTAHWLEATLIDTPAGPQYILTLRTDLIGFLRVPGHHDGEHLATAFLHIIDRIDIASRLGWVTLDNATNNDTFMAFLEIELCKRKIPFRKLHRRIRCFPHIVNLACKAILGAITNMDFAASGAADFVPGPAAPPRTILDAIARDPVATVRTSVRVIRASSLRRQYFSEVLKALQMKDLQLLRDVDTRWSSTLIMIDRAILLREVIDKFLSNTEFQDLKKYKLNDKEWEALEAFKRILAVPHAFQQRLSAERTPTLGDALPAFEAMISQWEKQQVRHPETAHIVQQGIDKLESYRDRVEDVPAYVLSMLINPAVKLSWFEKFRPDRVRWVKDLFLRELEGYRTDPSNTPAQSSRANWADEILGMDMPGRPTRRQSLEDEVRAYFLEPPYSFGSVRYWQENQLRHPTIFALAVDILPIQGSAVPCERVFSSSAETDTVRRNRTAPDLMEAFQMLKFSIKKGRGLNFTAGTSRDEEIALMEAETEERGLVPEDPTGYSSFIQSLLATEYDSE
ncbi:HAT family dimerization domain-containing protein [Mycena venus]|uniref:HAT family dimerization domain-containing protein n=1 Tax=Mycena venus TaxID=2733690 RepID=A0A8H7CU18_9AGAR|nr:HAT family dimerization domain-containing protein [Mycena venus]